MPQGSQAVISVFGRPQRAGAAGLVFVWPAPFGRLTILPGPTQDMTTPLPAAAPALTADGGIAVLSGVITWRVTAALAFLPMRDQATPLLATLFRHAVTQQAAARSLDDLRTNSAGAAADAAATVSRLLTQAGLNGVTVIRAELTTSLQTGTKDTSDAIALADAKAAAAHRAAIADAKRIAGEAAARRDMLLTTAHAAAAERISAARTATATIMALETRADARSRSNLLDQIYRDRIGGILARAASVDTVDAKAVSRLILPGAH